MTDTTSPSGSCVASANIEKILKCTRQIAMEVVAPDAESVDKEARWPERGLRALQKAGLGGLVVAEELGGLGQGAFALVRVGEILGSECTSTGLCYGMHCVGTAVIAAKATPDQRERYLTAIAEGRHLTTLALSEPGTGAHFYLSETKLESDGDDSYRVSGIKSFVTNGAHADSYVISTVAADPGAPPGQFSCVLVAEGVPGLDWQAPWDGMGMRGNSSRTLKLNGVQVAKRDLIGEEGDQIWYVFHVVAPYFLAAMAGTYLGLASTALEVAREHLAKRRYTTSGVCLAQLPVLQHRVGVMWGMLERTRRLVYHAARELDEGGPDALPALCSAKAEVADCAVTLVNEAMTLLGGIGYQYGGRMERLMRDARAAHVMAPTSDILRTWVGRAILGQPLLAD